MLANGHCRMAAPPDDEMRTMRIVLAVPLDNEGSTSREEGRGTREVGSLGEGGYYCTVLHVHM